MKRIPLSAVAVFALLATGGLTLASVGNAVATGFYQTFLENVGSSMFAGALAFFLVEMFQWKHQRSDSRGD